MAVVFIAQSTLQEWADAGKVRLEDDILVLLKERRQVSLRPAVRFTQVIGATADPNGLVGKVKTQAQLAELKAEHYMDSVLMGDVGYQVIEGFLGDLMASAPIGQTPPPAPEALGKDRSPTTPPIAAVAPKAAAPSGANDAEKTIEDDATALSRLFLDTVR
jgi:hypothetical protein